jgi:imidazolonepropionase-like amidohydrolase
MEADLWVRELGIAPMTVIRGMTLDAARVMGADRDSGSIAEGKLADVDRRPRRSAAAHRTSCANPRS